MLIPKRPWTRKPAAQVAKLNGDLPQGSFAHLLNSSLFATGAQRTGVYVAGNLPSQRGLECASDSWYEAGGVADWPSKAAQNRDAFTCVLVCYPNGIGTDVARFATGNTLGTGEKGWSLGYENRVAVSSPNKMRLMVANTSGTFQAGATFGKSLSAGERVVAVVTLDTTNIVVASNGVVDTLSWVGAAATGDATRALHVGRANFSSSLLQFNGLIEAICFIPARMSAAWVQLASLDPYRYILAPRRIYIPTSTAAATIPTLSNLSAINITSSSAQPQLTYTF